MAITTTILSKDIMGANWVYYGKSVIGGGVNTEELITGLRRVLSFSGTVKAAVASACSANEDFPLGKGTVTVYTTNVNETIYWEAIGNR